MRSSDFRRSGERHIWLGASERIDYSPANYLIEALHHSHHLFRGCPRNSLTDAFHLRVVIPAKAGIHLLPTNFTPSSDSEIDNMDSRFRGNDESGTAFAGMAIYRPSAPHSSAAQASAHCTR